MTSQFLGQLNRLKCVSVEQSPVLPADPHVAAFLFHHCLMRSTAARRDLANLASQVGDVVEIAGPSNDIFPKRRAACQPLMIVVVPVHDYHADVVPVEEVVEAGVALGLPALTSRIYRCRAMTLLMSA